jgi:hypothetical protein
VFFDGAGVHQYGKRTHIVSVFQHTAVLVPGTYYNLKGDKMKEKKGQKMKQRKTDLLGTTSILIAVLALLLSGCGGGGQKWEELSIDTDAVSNTFEAVKENINDLKAANEVIHSQTKLIIKGSQPVSSDLVARIKTPHKSSHAILLLIPYIEAAATEIDAYIANPESNRGKILCALGETEAYFKLVEAAVGNTNWAKLMKWPITDTNSHDLVHSFYEDEAITSIPEYKEAAGKLHDAMHGMESSTSSLELNLELLRDMIKTAGKIE